MFIPVLFSLKVTVSAQLIRVLFLFCFLFVFCNYCRHPQEFWLGCEKSGWWKRAGYWAPLPGISMAVLLKKTLYGAPVWHTRLRIQCCHCSGWGLSSGVCLVPGLETSICHRCGQKQTNKQTNTNKKPHKTVYKNRH